jgi:PhoH-like ATPase
VEALTYIRGRSLPKRYFIVDEAQNLRPIDVKTLVTRCGSGTKIVFAGDILQIDNPFMDSMSNGLSYLISRFINEENFCYLNLKESVRSKLAEQGARLL